MESVKESSNITQLTLGAIKINKQRWMAVLHGDFVNSYHSIITDLDPMQKKIKSVRT